MAMTSSCRSETCFMHSTGLSFGLFGLASTCCSNHINCGLFNHLWWRATRAHQAWWTKPCCPPPSQKVTVKVCRLVHLWKISIVKELSVLFFKRHWGGELVWPSKWETSLFIQISMYLLYIYYIKHSLKHCWWGSVKLFWDVDKYWQMSFSRHVSISSSHLGASANLMFCHMKSRNMEAWSSRPSLWKWRSAKRKKEMKTKEAGKGSCPW